MCNNNCVWGGEPDPPCQGFKNRPKCKGWEEKKHRMIWRHPPYTESISQWRKLYTERFFSVFFCLHLPHQLLCCSLDFITSHTISPLTSPFHFAVNFYTLVIETKWKIKCLRAVSSSGELKDALAMRDLVENLQTLITLATQVEFGM